MNVDNLCMETSLSGKVFKVFAVGLVYVILGRTLISLLDSDFVHVTWPLSGLALAVLLMNGAVYSASIFLGTIGLLFWQAVPMIAVGIAVARTLEIWLAWQFLTRTVNFDRQLNTLRDYGYLLLAGMVSSGIGAFFAGMSMIWADLLRLDVASMSFSGWWLGDVLGIMLFTPLVLIWRKSSLAWLKSVAIVEFLALLVLTFLTGQTMFFDWLHQSLGFVAHGHVMFLWVTWAAIRFGMQGVSVVLAMTAMQGLSGILLGKGHFANLEFGNPLLNYGFYMVVLSAVGIMFAAYFNERKQILDELKVAAIAFNAQQGILITDANGVILRMNRAFSEITGFSKTDIEAHQKCLFNSEKHDVDFYNALWSSVIATGKWQGELWMQYKDGSHHLQWLTLTEVKTERGIMTNYVGTLVDIAARKAAEEEIYRLAFYDPLTDLPNRRMLLDRLKYDIEVVRREGKQLAVMMLDLDRFKLVNDSFGHAAGDELLVLVAKRLDDRLRDVDLVARLGGDEFVILLGSIATPKDAAIVAEAIVADLSKPFKLTQSDDVRIGVSIGISLFPQPGDNPEMLLDQADRALYKAKNEGRGCFAYFSESITQEVRDRIELENRLRDALERNKLSVVYQPQVDIGSGRIVGAQMLVRWYDDEDGLIAPSRFIPVAELSGLIIQIGEWVLYEGCRQAKQWLDEGLPKLRLSVKLSPYQIQHSDINAVVANVLRITGFPADGLELELPDNALSEYDGSAGVLQRLRKQGVKLIVDDFSTGNWSLAYLQRFPLDTLKIGRVLIEEQGDMKVAATIVAVAKTLGMKTLAEGVETTEQLDFLEAEGCDTYQGYYKSHPVSAEEFVVLLKVNMSVLG